MTGWVVVAVTCAVLVLMAVTGALLMLAGDVPFDERAGLISEVRRSNERAGRFAAYRLCVGTAPSCDTFSVNPVDFRPALPELSDFRGFPVRLSIVGGTSDVVAVALGTTLHTSFAFRHPESRGWLLRLWGAALLFFPTLVLAIFIWAKTVGERRARERSPTSGDVLPRRGGAYLVALVSALVLLGAGVRVFGTLPVGAGQIANAFPPVVWLCWTWPVLIQNGLEWLFKRSRAQFLVERAEGAATVGGILAIFGLFVAPFELVVAWDASH
jgi:hypothetical protein